MCTFVCQLDQELNHVVFIPVSFMCIMENHDSPSDGIGRDFMGNSGRGGYGIASDTGSPEIDDSPFDLELLSHGTRGWKQET